MRLRQLRQRRVGSGGRGACSSLAERIAALLQRFQLLVVVADRRLDILPNTNTPSNADLKVSAVKFIKRQVQRTGIVVNH